MFPCLVTSINLQLVSSYPPQSVKRFHKGKINTPVSIYLFKALRKPKGYGLGMFTDIFFVKIISLRGPYKLGEGRGRWAVAYTLFTDRPGG